MCCLATSESPDSDAGSVLTPCAWLLSFTKPQLSHLRDGSGDTCYLCTAGKRIKQAAVCSPQPRAGGTLTERWPLLMQPDVLLLGCRRGPEAAQILPGFRSAESPGLCSLPVPGVLSSPRRGHSGLRVSQAVAGGGQFCTSLWRWGEGCLRWRIPSMDGHMLGAMCQGSERPKGCLHPLMGGVW